MAGNFTYNVTAPESLEDLIVTSNSYTGMVSVGIVMIIWLVVFGSIHRRGYRVADAIHAANFTATGISMVLFAFEALGGQVVVLMFTISSAMLTWKILSSRR